jgi:hypothetical protein
MLSGASGKYVDFEWNGATEQKETGAILLDFGVGRFPNSSDGHFGDGWMEWERKLARVASKQASKQLMTLCDS